jgi:bifunctional non-homologous end joining protein LigD
MALTEYNRKRDFAKTSEPRPRRTKSHRQPIFVIQEHHASRLHYDFRLEADGVLKSWAVPKPPTNDPATKRLAVHVEDHPLAYAKFSGEIPKGEYGAGKVRIWDKGTYENLLADKPQPRSVARAIEEGHVEVLLRGRKLKGKFALVRMNAAGKRDNWLLIKMKESRMTRAAKPSAGYSVKSGLSHSTLKSRPRTSVSGFRFYGSELYRWLAQVPKNDWSHRSCAKLPSLEVLNGSFVFFGGRAR